MSENWYCKILGMEMGPMSFDDLVQLAKRGNLRHDHPVRDGAHGDWAPAGTVEGLLPAQDSSAATVEFDVDPVVETRTPRAAPRVAEAAVEQKSQIETPASPPPPIQTPTSHRAPERTSEEAAPAKPEARTAETKRAKSGKAAKAPKPARQKKIASQRPATRREFRLDGKLLLAAACFAGVVLGAWALLGWKGQRRSMSLELTDSELVAACQTLHNELNSSRGTELTAQSLNGFEMQFRRRIQSLVFRVREAPAGSSGEKIAAALDVLAQMPRCAVSQSDASTYQEFERKLDDLLAQAGGGAGK